MTTRQKIGFGMVFVPIFAFDAVSISVLVCNHPGEFFLGLWVVSWFATGVSLILWDE
jgi:hypothetical protein